MPLQFNYDTGYGGGGRGHKTYLNLQPVIPVALSDRWNLISRTILPLVDQSGVLPGSNEPGMGDITQSFFFSPRTPASDGIVWGIGPAFLLPTASDPNLGAKSGVRDGPPWCCGKGTAGPPASSMNHPMVDRKREWVREPSRDQRHLPSTFRRLQHAEGGVDIRGERGIEL